jgi:hypothetical protein
MSHAYDIMLSGCAIMSNPRGDFPGMSEGWRKINWDLGYREESTAIAMRRCFESAGYDPTKDLMMNHTLLEGSTPAHFRSPDSMNDRGGLVVGWDLRTILEGLYAAGEQMFAPAAHGYAASTGRYAGRKAAAYASQAGRSAVSRDQIAREKSRVYAPIKRREGIEWKELHAGIARMMQYFCSEYKTEKLLNMGLDALNEIEKDFVPNLYALPSIKSGTSFAEPLSMALAKFDPKSDKARGSFRKP